MARQSTGPGGTKPSNSTGTSPAQPNGNATDSAANAKPAAVMSSGRDAISLIKADHRQVEQMFERYKSADEQQKRELRDQICKALTIHAMLEEEIFYPACRDAFEADELLDDAQVEHDSAKVLIADLQSDRDMRFTDAKVRVLAEQIKHHVAEEEKPRQGILAQAQKAGVNTTELGARLQERKSQLEGEERLPPGRPVSINPNSPQAKEYDMPNTQTRDRDDRGRFTDDDDRGRSRGRSRDDDDRGYSSRGSNDRERDEDGRFTSGGRGGGRGSSRDDDDRDSRGRGRGGWFGDSQGHSEASRRGWDDRDGGRSRSSRDDDDDRSYRSRSSSRDDDDRDSRGRGRGGWFGDSEGHSEAARRGWDDRDGGRSRSSRDDDDDRSYRSRSSNRDDDDRDSRGRGRGGWFGDSEGHSEAARRGWDDRDSSRSSSGRYDRDDDRGGRSSRGRDDDDDRGRSSRGRDDDDRDRGRGGWFGDSRGHAEAARRGWEDRR